MSAHYALDYNECLAKMDKLYCEAKLKQAGITPEQTAYWAPEQFPSIRSEQIKAMLRVLVDAINERM